MTATRNTLMILAALVLLLACAACTRDITTIEQVDSGPANCFSCHSDDDTDLTDKQYQWSFSSHGMGNYVGYAGGRSGCSGCHSGAGFEARLAGETEVPTGTPIRCFSCHAPHSNASFKLRVTDPQPLANGSTRDLGTSNICTACHVARRTVEETVVQDYPDSTGLDQVTITSSHWGGHHGPQGELFYGGNGYEFDGYTYHRDVPPAHMNAELGRCYGCHGNASPNADLGGHSFNQRNAAGGYNVAGCNNCHSGLKNFDFNGVQTETVEMLEVLHGLLEPLGLIDADGHPVEDGVGTADQVGAAWNFLTVEEDRSKGVHNPDYVHDLLQSSIEALGGTYPVP
jgi:hypothetical protein